MGAEARLLQIHTEARLGFIRAVVGGADEEQHCDKDMEVNGGRALEGASYAHHNVLL